LIEEASFYHFIAELSSKDFGQSFDRQIEVGSSRVEGWQTKPSQGGYYVAEAI
jgi:hypothetical protein